MRHSQAFSHPALHSIASSLPVARTLSVWVDGWCSLTCICTHERVRQTRRLALAIALANARPAHTRAPTHMHRRYQPSWTPPMSQYQSSLSAWVTKNLKRWRFSTAIARVWWTKMAGAHVRRCMICCVHVRGFCVCKPSASLLPLYCMYRLTGAYAQTKP